MCPTMKALRWCILWCAGALVLLSFPSAAEPPPSVINEISMAFGSAMTQCVASLYPNTSYLQEVFDFWNLNMDVTGRVPLGCLAACSLYNLHLRNREGKLDEDNINSLLFRSGADKQGASTLMEVFRTCNRPLETNPKACLGGLESMICFRSNMYRLSWTPQFYAGAYEYTLNGKK